MLYVILFVFASTGHPEKMQTATTETWPTMEACELVLENEGAKFALFMQAQNIQLIDTTGKCIADPRGG